MDKGGSNPKAKPSGYWNKKTVVAEAKKHKTIKSWRISSPSSYNIATKKRMLKKCTEHMFNSNSPYTQGNSRFRWTKELIIRESSKFKKWIDLINENPPLYTAIGRFGKEFRNKIKSTMITGRIIKWTKNKVAQEAKKYKKASIWSKNSPGSYQAAIKNDWYEEMKKLLTKAKSFPLTKEDVIKEAKKYQSRSEFKRGSYRHYRRSIKNKWIDDCCSHMNVSRNSIKWTKDKIMAEVSKFNKFSELVKERNALYSAMKKLGILHKIQDLMGYIPRNPIANLSKTDVLREAKKYNRRIDFCNHSNSHYQNACRNNWLEECCRHMMSHKDSCRHSGFLRTKWTKEKVLIEAKKYIYRSDFERQASGAYKSAKVNGWYEECVAHMKINKDHYKNKLPARWTIDEIYRELEKIKSWKEIYQNKQGMLEAIKRYGLTDEIKKRFKTRIAKFTYEELKEEALKYSNKQDFRKNQESMLRTIYERGLHHELLAHMNREGKEVFFQVERLLLHPKVKKIFEQLKIHFLYEKKYIIDNHLIIPDFVFDRDNTIYIIEVKTSYRKFRQAVIDDQILKQTEIIKKLNPDKKIIHILLSEYGFIKSLKSNYSMSLDEFKIFLDTGEYICQEKVYQKPKELANQIEQEFRSKFVTNVDRQKV